MQAKNWIQAAADEIYLIAHRLPGRDAVETIIRRHCPFKDGVAYEEVAQSVPAADFPFPGLKSAQERANEELAPAAPAAPGEANAEPSSPEPGAAPDRS